MDLTPEQIQRTAEIARRYLRAGMSETDAIVEALCEVLPSKRVRLGGDIRQQIAARSRMPEPSRGIDEN